MTQPIYQANGGNRTHCTFSGSAALNDILIQSGAGRLNAIVPHVSQQVLSGVAIIFYDSAIATSGGPHVASGHKILAAINAPQGLSGQLSPAGVAVPYGIPFNSGLCVATKSGQVGFTVGYTLEDLR